MGDSEKFEAQGRAHDTLKKYKSTVATAKTVLLDYSERLETANRLVKRFIETPLDKSATGAPLADHLKDTIHALFVAELDGQVDELAYLTKRIAELQPQVDNF